jgi:hypothetical protein
MTTCVGGVPAEFCPLDVGLTVVHAASRPTAAPATASFTAVREPATDVTPSSFIYQNLTSYMIYDA